MFRKRSKGEVTVPESTPSKKKKPFYKKWWFWLLLVIVIGAAASSGGSSDKKKPSSASTTATTSTPTPIPEPTANIPLANAAETAVWENVTSHGGELSSVETIEQKDSSLFIVAAVKAPNEEETVEAIASGISKYVLDSAENESVMLSISDIQDKDDTLIVLASLYNDGTVDISSMSLDYNSARNKWIKGQFSVWDGSHTVLTKLIKQNLNDEKSYTHISTTYRDIKTEDIKNDVNKVLSDAGYSQQVEVGDLFIQTQFSAKNAFNATIKNTAFGIARYADNTVVLIDIG